VNNQFLSLPAYRPLDDGVNWLSTAKLKYVDPWGGLIIIPVGVRSDFASIPNLSLLGLIALLAALAGVQWFPSLAIPFYILAAFAVWVIAIAEQFLHEGTWDNQAFLHDWMFKTRCRTFWQANWILFVSMVAKGAPTTPLWKRLLIFGGVAAGGWFAWRDDARRLHPLCPKP
jgi:hypothetical protein